MSDERRRIPGWVLVLVMAAFIGVIGVGIYLGIRPDPTLPPVIVEKR